MCLHSSRIILECYAKNAKHHLLVTALRRFWFVCLFFFGVVVVVYWLVLQFHRVRESTHTHTHFTISMVRRKREMEMEIEREIEKCAIVCMRLALRLSIFRHLLVILYLCLHLQIHAANSTNSERFFFLSLLLSLVFALIFRLAFLLNVQLKPTESNVHRSRQTFGSRDAFAETIKIDRINNWPSRTVKPMKRNEMKSKNKRKKWNEIECKINMQSKVYAWPRGFGFRIGFSDYFTRPR